MLSAVPLENRMRSRLINPLGYLHVLSPLLAADVESLEFSMLHFGLEDCHRPCGVSSFMISCTYCRRLAYG